jgi:hypothetical protein
MYQGVFHWEFDVLRGTKKGAAISARVGKSLFLERSLSSQTKSDPNSSLDFDCLARSTQLQSSCTRTHALEGMTSQIGLGPMNLQTKFSGAMSPYMKCKPFSICLVLLMKEVGHLVCKGQLIVCQLNISLI